MPQRVNQGASRVVAVVGTGAGIMTYLAEAPNYIGLAPALNIFNAFLLGITLLFLWLLHKDMEDMNASSPEADEEEEEPISADGGIVLPPDLYQLKEESPEGGGALAGLIAGGALGMLGGPAAVVLGGLVGGILGNEAEYKQIVERYQDALGNTAINALDQEPVSAPRPYTINDLDYRQNDEVYEVQIEDAEGSLHTICLNLDDQSYVYEG